MDTAKRINPNLDPVTGKFVPGNNANPKGRVPIAQGGKRNWYKEFQDILEKGAGEVLQTVLTKAKEGDMAAAKLVLERFSPSLKAVEHRSADGNLPVLQIIRKSDNVEVGILPMDNQDNIVEGEVVGSSPVDKSNT